MLSAVFLGYLIGVTVRNFTASAQTNTKESSNSDKIIEQAFTINPQVKVLQIKDGDKTLKFNESFEGDEIWLKNLSFQLENISKKPITVLQININFPETKASGNLMSYPIVIGRMPVPDLPVKKAPLLLKEKETLEISTKEDYDRIVKFIERRQPFSTITKVQFEIGFIVFEDNTSWAAGQFSRQDPNNPRRWIPIEVP